eukprot:scaffold2033_cov164-Amphora_coffeaeformis.AAC.16
MGLRRCGRPLSSSSMVILLKTYGAFARLSSVVGDDDDTSRMLRLETTTLLGSSTTNSNDRSSE